jgi:hypothetical protein
MRRQKKSKKGNEKAKSSNTNKATRHEKTKEHKIGESD